MNDIIAKNIKKYRELKGFSQEYMAHQLSVNQSTYAKMENSSTKITIDKLFSVAKLLETDVSEILDLKNQTIFNQTDNETANAFGKVEHYYQENKEVYQELLKAKDEQIALLKEMLDKKIKDVLILDNYPKLTFFQIYNIHKITFPLAEAIKPSVSLDEVQF